MPSGPTAWFIVHRGPISSDCMHACHWSIKASGRLVLVGHHPTTQGLLRKGTVDFSAFFSLPLVSEQGGIKVGYTIV